MGRFLTHEVEAYKRLFFLPFHYFSCAYQSIYQLFTISYPAIFAIKKTHPLKWDRPPQNSKNLFGGVSNAFAILNKVVNEIGLYVLDSIDPI